MAKKKPQRMCVACRVMKDKASLIRLAVNQSGEVFLDPAGKKPGRGAYACRSRQCLQEALQGHKFEKGLKTRIDETVINQLIAQMEALPEDNPAQADDRQI